MITEPPRVIVYELNEVPWRIVDLYLAARPASALASLSKSGWLRTTVNTDPVPLEPWRTWPTFHKSVFTDRHNSFDLGQDPSTFRCESLWEVAEQAGKSIGIFGPLQSWPARRPKAGGFYVPDTFSRDAATFPRRLTRFQDFNLQMTRSNTFTADSPLSTVDLVRVGASLLRNGLSFRSATEISRHLLRERADVRHKGQRPMVQALPSFDLFWRLWCETRPSLAVFFTNHVAAMMHRYWGDTVPEYRSAERYPVDDVFQHFVLNAMEVFDRHLARMVKAAGNDANLTIIVASSMGQGPIRYHENDVDELFVLDRPTRLVDALELGLSEPGLAMYPRTSLMFPTDALALAAAKQLRTVRTSNGQPLFADVRASGRSVSVGIDIGLTPRGSTELLTFEPANGPTRVAPAPALGLSARRRVGRGNTAHHIPQGIFMAFGPRAKNDTSRAEVSVLDAAPSILDLIGVEPGESMAGASTIFRQRSGSANRSKIQDERVRAGLSTSDRS